MKRAIRKRTIIVVPEHSLSGDIVSRIKRCLSVARERFSISHSKDLLKWVLLDSTDSKYKNYRLVIKVVPLVGGTTRAFDIVSTCYVETRADRKIARELQRNFHSILTIKNVEEEKSVSRAIRELKKEREHV